MGTKPEARVGDHQGLRATGTAERKRTPRPGLGGRVLLGFVGLFAAVWLATLFLGVVPNFILRALGATERLRLTIGGTISRGGMMAVTVWLSVWTLRRVTGLPAAELLYARHPGWWHDLIVGVLLGGGAMALVFFLETWLGWLSVRGWALDGETYGTALSTLWLALLANGLASVGEEALFRGYFLTGLARAWGPWLGLVVMSIPFGAVHLLVHGSSETNAVLFTLLLALPGALLGWTYLRSGSLWLAMGIHFAWDLFQDDIFDLTSGAGPNRIGLVTERSGPAWFMGTSYGIEVGVAGIVALLVVGSGVAWWTRTRPRPAVPVAEEADPPGPGR